MTATVSATAPVGDVDRAVGYGTATPDQLAEIEHSALTSTLARQLASVPVVPFEESTAPSGRVYPGGIRVGDELLTAQQQVDRAQDPALPDWWPTAYIGTDGTVSLTIDHTLTHDQFRAWLIMATAAINSPAVTS